MNNEMAAPVVAPLLDDNATDVAGASNNEAAAEVALSLVAEHVQAPDSDNGRTLDENESEVSFSLITSVGDNDW